MDSIVSNDGRAVVRHYLLDFGSTLGSGGIGPHERRDGYEYIFEGGPMKTALPALGLAHRRWMTIPYPDDQRIGRFESARFAPTDWKPRFPNPAFIQARPDDLFWAALRLKTVITDDLIRAAVKAGQYTDPQAADALVRTLIERRDKIARAWLPAVNPVVDVALADGALAFRNAAVQYGAAQAPASYSAVWSQFDNDTGQTRRIGETSGGERMTAASDLPSQPGAYIQVDVSATDASHPAWAAPVHAWFKRTGAGWKFVGFERLP
jgi:hypothetical protein